MVPCSVQWKLLNGWMVNIVFLFLGISKLPITQNKVQRFIMLPDRILAICRLSFCSVSCTARARQPVSHASRVSGGGSPWQKSQWLAVKWICARGEKWEKKGVAPWVCRRSTHDFTHPVQFLLIFLPPRLHQCYLPLFTKFLLARVAWKTLPHHNSSLKETSESMAVKRRSSSLSLLPVFVGSECPGPNQRHFWLALWDV